MQSARGFGQRQPFLAEEIRPCCFQETPLPAVVLTVRTGVLGVCSCAALTTCKRGLISPHNKYGENLGGGPRNFKHVRGVHQHGHGGEGLPVLRACLPTLLMDSTAF